MALDVIRKVRIFVLNHGAFVILRSAVFAVGAVVLLFALVHTYAYYNYIESSMKEIRDHVASEGYLDESGSLRLMPILMPLYSHEDYLRQVLQYLEKTDDIDSIVLIGSQDGHSPVIEKIFKESKIPNKVHFFHRKPFFGLPSYIMNGEYATSANIRYLLGLAFDALHAPEAVVLESDLLVSQDFIPYFRWAFSEVRANKTLNDAVFCVNAFQINSRATSHKEVYTMRVSPFTVWGWGLLRTRWDSLKPEWTRFSNWDFAVQAHRDKNGLVCLDPLLSRVKNIGMSGENFHSNPDINHPDNQGFNSVYLQNRSLDYKHVPLTVNFGHGVGKKL